MGKTNIEWVKNPDGSKGYTWNPITGCLNHENGLCKGGGFPCYAYKLANTRLKQGYLANMNCPTSVDFRNGQYKPDADAYLNPFYPRFWEERLYHPWDGRPKGTFVCDMGDLFGIGIPQEWTRKVLNLCRRHEQNRYYLLTKQPQRLPEFSPFPDNCWVGVTATNQESYYDAVSNIAKVEAKVKFVSFEPLLEQINGGECTEECRLDSIDEFDWAIIGACTGSYDDMKALCERYPDLDWRDNANFTKFVALPKIEDLKEIVEAADKAGIKVFLKDNLKPLINDPMNKWQFPKLRQELPEG